MPTSASHSSKLRRVGALRPHLRAQPRLDAIVFALFAVAAIALAAVGRFDDPHQLWCASRTHESGIRMALGATAEHVGASVVLRGLSLALIGTAIWHLRRPRGGSIHVGAPLFEVSPGHSLTLLTVAVLMVVVAAIASARSLRAWECESSASDRAAKRNLRRSLDHCTTIQCPTHS